MRWTIILLVFYSMNWLSGKVENSPLENLFRNPPFGYEHSNANLKEDIKKGITDEIMDKIKNAEMKDLIKRLLEVPVLRSKINITER